MTDLPDSEVTIYPFYAAPILLMIWFGDLRFRNSTPMGQ